MSRTLSLRCRGALWLAGVVLWAAVACPAPAAAEEPRQPPEFLRVHVPRGRLTDVPLGTERYVPMSAAEFEEAVARLGPPGQAAADAPRPLANRSRYALTVDESGRLAGRVTFELPAATDGTPREIVLGAVRPGRCALRTAGGTGEAAVFGRADGTVAVRTPEAGAYDCELSVGPTRPGAAVFTLPLVPALATTLAVRPPAGMRPIISGEPAGQAVVARGAGDEWLVEFGPAASVGIAFGADEPAPLVAAWTDAVVRGGRVEFATAFVPRSAWVPRDLAFEKPPGLRIVAAELTGRGRPLDWQDAADGRTAVVRLPRELAGTREAVVVRGVAALGGSSPWLVPAVRPPAAAWAGGGTRLEIDPALGVIGTTATDCLPVTPEIAGRWPLPTRTRRTPAGADDAQRPALLHFEQQSADATLALTLRPRQPQLDVARVTTVELSPGQVVGRAACDVRVVTGDAFAVTAQVVPGWIIDKVEMVEPFDADAGGDERPSAAGTEVDWRLVGRDGGTELLVGLALAATPRRSIGLRVAGHRPGVPLGGGFRPSDMDMVRFAGEAADTAVIDFSVAPEAVVEVEGAPLGVFAVPPRLVPLVEPGTLRGRVPAGDRAAAREARLVQRRPPLDVRVEVRLAALDERLSESYTLACRPEAAAADSIVVHFSEPMGESLAWSLLEPSDGSLVARRLDAADTARGEGLRVPACAESWLVEITPAFTGEVTVRAARDVPFREPRPVPLAWVEGATTSRGTVIVGDTGPGRPTVLNRRLRELPPAAGAAGRQPVVAEFAFTAPRAGDDAGAAAELRPAEGADARAWAWLESVSCRCHESGRAECASAYDIENHGRDAVSLTVLPGRRVEEVLIDGDVVPIESLDGGGAARVPLPPQRRRIHLVVRSLADGVPTLGGWRIDPGGCAIDVPVLEQRLDMLLPPGLEIGAVLGGYRAEAEAGPGLVTRLLAARPGGLTSRVATWPAGRGPRRHAADGFRTLRFVPVAGSAATGDMLVVRRSLVASAALVLGFAAFLGMLLLRGRNAVAALLAVGAAAAAMWLDPPLATVARAALWGAVAGSVCRGLVAARVARVAAAWLVALGACGATGAAAAETAPTTEPLKVFLAPDDEGGLALVPETLYRALAQESRPAVAPVRIVRCRVLVEERAPGAAWRLLLDVDADAGGSITLDQGPGDARWEPAARADARVQVLRDGRQVRITTPESGSQRLELRGVPAVDRRGCLEIASLRLPPAAVTRLELVDASAATVPVPADALQCDRAAAGGPFLAAPVAGRGETGFDVSGADRVRLVRPLDRRHRLASTGLAATSANELEWDLAGCRVRARFDLAGEAVVRRIVVAADPGLEPVFDDLLDGQTVSPLGDGRYLLERIAPQPGPARLGLDLRLPLADPVGTFTVPGAWLEDVEADARTVRLAASADLVATFDPLPGQPAETWAELAGTGGEVRRYDVGRSAAGTGPTRLAVSRRRQEIRGSQALAVSLEDDFIGLRLRGRIDATTVPLLEIPVEMPPGCAIERVTLREDDLAAADAAVRPPLDLQWAATAANRLMIVLQHPRAGRYRLEIEARLPVRPVAQGRIPLLRAELAGNTPLVVSWSRRGRAAETTVEVPVDAQGPTYELDDDPPAEFRSAAAPTPADAAAPRGEDRVEQTLVSLAIDGRGRARGIARLDLVTSRPTIRLRLPPRTRLYDALVDGREATTRPVTAEVWEVPLHEADWPRSLMLVFAGDLGPTIGTGQAVRLAAPAVEGLPCGDVLWQVDPPPGAALRVAEPARPLAGADWEQAVAAGRERVAAAFSRAASGDDMAAAARLRAYAEARSAGKSEPLEESWERALEPAGAERVRAVTPGDHGLTVRVVDLEDPSRSPRTAATALLAACAAWTWLTARRRTRFWGRAAAVTPWLLVGAGAAWVTMLVPTLPGWLLLAAGGLAVAVARRPPGADHAVAAAVRQRREFDSTRSLPAG
jgi:hypothetical protein